MFVLLYKETLLEINDLDSSLPSIVSSLLQEFKYVIPEDDPGDLPPEETKEIQSKWRNLLVHVLYMYYLIPKKMECGGYVFIFIPSTTLWLRFGDESFRGKGE